MLRSQLGSDLYRRCIKTWLERHAYGSVVTEDLNRVIEELSGRSFDQFFDQWVYHGGTPDLDVSYAWDARTKLARVSVRQVQKVDDNVALFNFPLTVRFKSKSGATDKTINVKQKAEDFYFALDEAPVGVRIDPEFTVLARVKFDPPSAMLDAQLKDSDDVIGRLLAVETFSKRRDKDSVAKLKKALNNDRFYAVRMEAARALRSIHNDDALDALLNSTDQSDARVRQAVISAIGGFFHERAYTAKTANLKTEKNPEIQADAIEGLGAYPNPEVGEILLRFLNSTSYRNSLAVASVRAMRTANDPAYIEPLRQNLQEHGSAYPSYGLSSGLETLAVLARGRDEHVNGVREFLTGYVNHPRRTVRVGALNALGTLEDRRAVPVLEKFTTAYVGSPEQRAATNALRRIITSQRIVEGLGELRTTVMELQKENTKLKEDFKTLEKKVEALAPRPEEKKKRATAVKSPRAQSR
jgi:aminopeptidase N